MPFQVTSNRAFVKQLLVHNYRLLNIPLNMSIADGLYQIFCAADNVPIGRALAEDLSLLPKRVITLPPDAAPTRPWIVIKNPNDTFTIKVADAPTAEIDGKLFGVLLDSPPPTEWKLTPIERNGPDAYIVTTSDLVKGWVVPDVEPQNQIDVRPLIVGLSEPPFYPPTEVFIFKRLE
ncbi:proteinase inhibitor [Irpex rosettiformis]|uniref:Proteinase inhibitor n=1 Tax=Irpex rosettiformis TaxID=378272 RepID=A0ACB8U351_9APHY|nr:proteinase inhibitor [Irpex rosettiformis]